jgi:glutamyl-tRNA synthetase
VPFLERAGYDVTAEALTPIVPLIQERLKTLQDVVAWTGFFFEEALAHDVALLIGKKMTPAESLAALRLAREALARIVPFDTETIEVALRGLAEELGVKVGPLFGILRGAISAQKVSPPLFESIEILGRDESLARIDAAIEVLSARAEE